MKFAQALKLVFSFFFLLFFFVACRGGHFEKAAKNEEATKAEVSDSQKKGVIQKENGKFQLELVSSELSSDNSSSDIFKVLATFRIRTTSNEPIRGQVARIEVFHEKALFAEVLSPASLPNGNFLASLEFKKHPEDPQAIYRFGLRLKTTDWESATYSCQFQNSSSSPLSQLQKIKMEFQSSTSYTPLQILGRIESVSSVKKSEVDKLTTRYQIEAKISLKNASTQMPLNKKTRIVYELNGEKPQIAREEQISNGILSLYFNVDHQALENPRRESFDLRISLPDFPQSEAVHFSRQLSFDQNPVSPLLPEDAVVRPNIPEGWREQRPIEISDPKMEIVEENKKSFVYQFSGRLLLGRLNLNGDGRDWTEIPLKNFTILGKIFIFERNPRQKPTKPIYKNLISLKSASSLNEENRLQIRFEVPRDFSRDDFVLYLLIRLPEIPRTKDLLESYDTFKNQLVSLDVKTAAEILGELEVADLYRFSD